jgi:acyl carrier protein
MDKDYELTVFTQVINKHLDEIIFVTEESLKYLITNRDQVVYDLATKIYTQSGHKVELAIIRDIVNSRTEDLSYKFVAEQKSIQDEAHRKEQKRFQEQERLRLTKQEYFEQEHILREKFEGNKSKVLIFIKVQKIFCEVLSIRESYIDLEFNLFDELGNNSIAFLETIFALEEGFDIKISDEDSDNFGVMQEIVNYIHQKQASS